MQGPYIDYNEHHPELEEVLKSVDRPGSFFAHGRLVAPSPRVSVEGVGTIAFPIQESQIRSLIQVAERAPFGRGQETLHDTSVRDCWQIEARRVRVGGLGWRKTFRSIIESAAEGLGIEVNRIKAVPYKLLVYEQGGFFALHRDTEKADGMVATLVISLPVDGEGGELVIRHKRHEEEIDTCVADPTELAFAAFYADCEHLTKPVLRGHRVALTFNLVVKSRSRSVPSMAPDHSSQPEAAAELLSRWASTSGPPDKIVWLMDHTYSRPGLRFDALKGIDAQVGKVLKVGARRADCALHLAIVRIEELCAPDEDEIYDLNLNYGHVDEDFTGRTCAIQELFEWSYSLEGWIAPDGTPAGFPEIPLLPEEALPGGALDNTEPDEQRLSGFTGNEGVTLERSYRAAAFVLWPRSRYVSVLAGVGIETAIGYVRKRLERAESREESSAERTHLISQVIDSWPKKQYQYMRRTHYKMGTNFKDMLALLSSVSDSQLSQRFLTRVVTGNYGGRMNDALVGFLRGLDPSVTEAFLPDWAGTHAPRQLDDVLELLTGLSDGFKPQESLRWNNLLQDSVRRVFGALREALEPTLPAGQPEWKRARPLVLEPKAVSDLFVLGHKFSVDAEAADAISLLAAHEKEADPYRTLPEALRQIGRRSAGCTATPAFGSLWQVSADRLLARSASPPAAPTNLPLILHLCQGLIFGINE